MTWLESLIRATENAESPKRYFLWAGLSAISAIVKRNVYLDKFYYKLYPNLYVILEGPSGLRKSFPVSVAKKLVEMVDNTKVIAGRSSIQAILKELSLARTKPDGKVITEAAGFIASGEFAASLVQDDQALTIMNDLYDAHYNDTWKNTLKGSGTEELKEPYVVMLTASNQALLKQVISEREILGGFLARTLIVSERQPSRLNSLMTKPDFTLDYAGLSEHLKLISMVKGAFSLEPAALNFFDEWYNDFFSKLFKNNGGEDKTGTSNRIHDQILKVAMLLSLSRGDSLIVTLQDLEEAMEHCGGFVRSAEKVTMGTGKAQLAEQTASILRELLSREDYQIGRVKLLQKYYGQFDSFDLDRIIETLNQANLIENHGTGKTTVYRLTSTAKKLYLQQ